jgi:hypothetical protein
LLASRAIVLEPATQGSSMSEAQALTQFYGFPDAQTQ